MRKHALGILTVVNVFFFLVSLTAFLARGARFEAPWDGPAVVTVALAAATLVLAAVAIGVALLTIWGYTTLREHAENIAKNAASETAETVAIRSTLAWLERNPLLVPGANPPDGESVADAYSGESQ